MEKKFVRFPSMQFMNFDLKRGGSRTITNSQPVTFQMKNMSGIKAICCETAHSGMYVSTQAMRGDSVKIYRKSENKKKG